MDLFFVDDAGQKKPSRPGMGALLAIGGVHVPEQSTQELEGLIDKECADCGFPPDEVFKWSPGQELWMSRNLVEEQRQQFFIRVLSLAKEHGATAFVIIEDTTFDFATQKAKTPEIDLVQLLLERAQFQLVAGQCKGLIIVSQTGGDRKAENKFLAECIESLKSGTDYRPPDNVVMILCTSHKFSRLLQLADVVASCTTAFVSGENVWSPTVFSAIKPLLATAQGRIGGVGLKIHPDLKYANLYHWLVGDSHFWKSNMGIPLPLPGYPYSSDPLSP